MIMTSYNDNDHNNARSESATEGRTALSPFNRLTIGRIRVCMNHIYIYIYVYTLYPL